MKDTFSSFVMRHLDPLGLTPSSSAGTLRSFQDDAWHPCVNPRLLDSWDPPFSFLRSSSCLQLQLGASDPNHRGRKVPDVMVAGS